ncbi:glutathione S-transferase family protein [Synechococcus sp. CS-602]|uniref:glutathione S-transferase family protein n=1 Tax=Synechococcaceae TaxID=1890426 RepID=UPI0008FF2E25|nr:MULTISPECIES: glutathione S-transferase family protein [Synechococcaceae]MCT4365079.1 glutathione S-transferase family protein [Candidatus Regnicoccus frigidus MAG-AL1]APD47253.1 glutathione S-transferase [Synechococcus sp. SynAce01]MCT0202107.1 glutathione S-transferase family protein [Synechococcus sp. CS-603]MCT0205713.1 glutathione S-transferase family protein [Synechococcus sp. CS-602]MCT0244886.1 glutathione S-transferase family protein [Synechococcus sp. CS-601]
MTLTLYGGARSRASMPRWYLAEKQIPYTWIQLDMAAGEHRQEPFLSLNPFAKVPLLVDEGASSADSGSLRLFESGAILLYLADRYGHEFSSPAQRAEAEQWVLFANATLATALFVEAAREKEFPRLMAALNTRLEGGAPLLGEAWGVADCAVQAHLAYLPIFFPQLDLGAYPHVQASIEATQGRVAYQAAMATG